MSGSPSERPSVGAGEGAADEPKATERGGVIVRTKEQTYFVAHECVLRIVPRPPIERVPGSPNELLGIALDAGILLPVIALGPDASGPLLVCRYAGEAIALAGLSILATGRFPTEPNDPPSTVRYEGAVAAHLDLATAYARVQPGPWAGRFSQ